LIGWTFDPLQRGNANFNFNRLGVVVRAYHVNFYGEMNDDINSGLASDRFEAWWDVFANRDAAYGQQETVGAENLQPVFLIQTDERGHILQSGAASWDAETYAVEIPYDINVRNTTTWTGDPMAIFS
jgi:predicted GNAT superfamily acetyltransferase